MSFLQLAFRKISEKSIQIKEKKVLAGCSGRKVGMICYFLLILRSWEIMSMKFVYKIIQMVCKCNKISQMLNIMEFTYIV